MDLTAKTVFGFCEPMVGVVVDLPIIGNLRASFEVLPQVIELNSVTRSRLPRLRRAAAFDFGARRQSIDSYAVSLGVKMGA
jgi:hypothetical protein